MKFTMSERLESLSKRSTGYHRATQRETRQAPDMTEKAEEMQDTTRERIREAAQSGVIQLIIPAAMALGMFFLGFAVNRLSDHFDRIDAHLAASDTSTAVDHKDIGDLKALVPLREAQIKEIRDLSQKTAWTVDEMQRDRVRH